MKILIVDDSKESRILVESILIKAGYDDFLFAPSADEAFKILEKQYKDEDFIDLILLDIFMPGTNGIKATAKIRSDNRFEDIPIIIVTASNDEEDLKEAFEAGAIDYVTKPFRRTEMQARVGSVLKMKKEMDRRKDLVAQLEKANMKLQALSALDGLTGLANRRHFDQMIDREWRRCVRLGLPLSFMMIDIDFFKNYNDRYGHQQGDDCLKTVASLIQSEARRPGDLAARYGGEEFALVLAETDREGASAVAEILRQEIEGLKLTHENSEVSKYVTISIGVAFEKPKRGASKMKIIESADKALYQAKREGRNRVVMADNRKSEPVKGESNG